VLKLWFYWLRDDLQNFNSGLFHGSCTLSCSLSFLFLFFLASDYIGIEQNLISKMH
jgi:hypothetical protein